MTKNAEHLLLYSQVIWIFYKVPEALSLFFHSGVLTFPYLIAVLCSLIFSTLLMILFDEVLILRTCLLWLVFLCVYVHPNEKIFSQLKVILTIILYYYLLMAYFHILVYTHLELSDGKLTSDFFTFCCITSYSITVNCKDCPFPTKLQCYFCHKSNVHIHAGFFMGFRFHFIFLFISPVNTVLSF